MTRAMIFIDTVAFVTVRTARGLATRNYSFAPYMPRGALRYFLPPRCADTNVARAFEPHAFWRSATIRKNPM
jgi:hypothetical protein